MTAGTIPEGYCFTTFQALFTDFVAQLTGYVPGTYNFFNYGDTSPAPADRDKPWLRTVAGIPDRWYVYANLYGEWVWPHEVPQADSKRSMWVGAEADLKTYDGGEDTAVTATTGPFWEVDTNFVGRSPMGVGVIPGRTLSPTSINIGDNIGEAEHTQTTDELVAHKHANPTAQDTVAVDKSGAAGGIGLDFTGGGTHKETDWTKSVGGGLPSNVIHPVRGCYIIKRTSRIFRRTV